MLVLKLTIGLPHDIMKCIYLFTHQFYSKQVFPLSFLISQIIENVRVSIGVRYQFGLLRIVLYCVVLCHVMLY